MAFVLHWLRYLSSEQSRGRAASMLQTLMAQFGPSAMTQWPCSTSPPENPTDEFAEGGQVKSPIDRGRVDLHVESQEMTSRVAK
eukprot:4584592-Lingulodinium_polyedra.AAC.1